MIDKQEFYHGAAILRVLEDARCQSVRKQDFGYLHSTSSEGESQGGLRSLLAGSAGSGLSRKEYVRPMVRKWGSCSTTGRLTFNVELLTQPAPFRRRVIVEELLHLKVPNHGKLFKALLKAHLGKTNGSETLSSEASRLR